MKRCRWHTWCGVLAGMTVSAAVVAQPVHKGVKFEAVEGTIADMGPLSLGQRILRSDLRLPSGFDQVYRVSVPGGEPVFARVANGVTAIFPRSVYSATEMGLQATIPPGTIFSIGGDLRALLPSSVASASVRRNWAGASMFADRSVERSGRMPSVLMRNADPYADPAAVRVRDVEVEPLPTNEGPATIWNNEVLRKRRLAALLAF